MQTTETVLKVYESRGKSGKPLKGLYRQLFKREIYLKAYSQIYSNPGAITEGINEETMDDMSLERMDKIIEKVRGEKYRWREVRRVQIPKKNGGTRPIGTPTGNDKLLQAAIRILLESYYEPTFSERSHGFRPLRGCHTALIQIDRKHRGTNWFIEGDIKGCFDNIDHKTLMGILEERIEDGRMLKLIGNLLKAGYMENWKRYDTHSGTPQGGIISPLLANIYLDKLDKWVEKELLPNYNHSHKGKGRKRRNREYENLHLRANYAKKNGRREEAKNFLKLTKTLPSVNVNDEEYRKLEYVRYADDFLLSFGGPKKEAEEIKEKIRYFLKRELKLELSEEKTLITHARTEKARFLGYNLKLTQTNEKRMANGNFWFGIPREVIEEARKKYRKKGKPHHRAEFLSESDYQIVAQFQSEYRGLVQYFTMAHNIHTLNKVNNDARTSLLKTLAAKHKTTSSKIARKYKTSLEEKGRMYKVIMVEVKREGKKTLKSHFGAIPLTRNSRPTGISDKKKTRRNTRSEIIKRLLAEECEMCGEKEGLQSHHINALKNVNKPGRKKKEAWKYRMSAMKRKTLMVCKTCHKAIHKGEHRREWDAYKNTLESRVQ